jgi:hypothetical protein
MSDKPQNENGRDKARTPPGARESDDHLGALETDAPGQPGQGNPNVPALDENGQPADWKKICEDVIGANIDESEGG